MTKKQTYLTIIFGIIFCAGLYDFLSNFKTQEKQLELQEENLYKEYSKDKKEQKSEKTNTDIKKLIDELTDENLVTNYIKKHRKLPGYYITKSEAKKLGWTPSKGNLCEVLPGKAIGGDTFGNREGKLPKEGAYFEADVNYKCGNRNAERIVFNKKGEVWLTKDHYRTFEKQ